MKPNRSRRRLSIALSIVALLVAILGGEVILRIVKPVQAVGVSHKPLIYERDEHIGYRYSARAKGWMRRHIEMNNQVVINSDGFHDVERTDQDQSDLTRIVAIGDSFTASIHVPVPATWTQIVEQELRQRVGPSFSVINRGLDGTGTDVHLSLLSSYLKTHTARAVILAFYANDLRDVSRSRVYQEVYDEYVISYQSDSQREQIVRHIRENRPWGLTGALYRGSYLFRALLNGVGKGSLLRSNVVKPKDVGLELISTLSEGQTKVRMTALLTEMASLSERRGIVLFVVPVPTREDPKGSYRVLRSVTTPDFLRRLNVIDVTPLIQQSLNESGLEYSQLFWNHDGHFNTAGNRLFGISVAMTLARDRTFLPE